MYRTRWHALPDVAFPPGGRLGLTSPRSPVICDATTATSPSRGSSLVARSPIPCLLPTVCVPRGSSCGGSSPTTPGLLVSRYPCSSGALDKETKETNNSLQFLSYPLKCMPRSQTPVVSCALAIAHPGLLPSSHWKPSADHDYTHFGAPSRGLSPRYTRLRTAPGGEARGFATDLLARL